MTAPSASTTPSAPPARLPAPPAPPPSEPSWSRLAPDLVVTGEAVALDIVPATLASRLLSGLIDYTTYALGLLLSTWTLAVVSPALSDASSAAALVLLVVVWTVLVPLAVELLTRGLSAGRLVVGTRVVRDDGGSVRLRHSLVRALVGIVEVWALQAVPAVCVCAATRRGKRLGDLLAGTYVVRHRHQASTRTPLLMPPELATWAAATDLTALPGELTLVVHTFLQRASSFQDSARRRLGDQLAAQVQDYVSPLPPAGTHPERFLAAVLVERRNRDLVLEARDRQLEEAVRHEMMRLPFGIGQEDAPQQPSRAATTPPSPPAAP